MRKYGESKTIRIMMATVRFGTSKISGRWIFVDTSVHVEYINEPCGQHAEVFIAIDGIPYTYHM